LFSSFFAVNPSEHRYWQPFYNSMARLGKGFWPKKWVLVKIFLPHDSGMWAWGRTSS
jgi:hypothetical protein